MRNNNSDDNHANNYNQPFVIMAVTLSCCALRGVCVCVSEA